jgi:hypothetical protein
MLDLFYYKDKKTDRNTRLAEHFPESVPDLDKERS